MRFFKHQHYHLLSLLVLLVGLYYFISLDSTFLEGQLWSITTSVWLVLAILSPILHQIYVLICWRLELIHKSITKTFGDSGFKLYKVGFAILILARPVTITLLAFANADTLDIHPTLAYSIAAILFIPSAYLAYSVKTYFGIDRAFGIDHFHPERLKDMPFVKGGIFKYTSNGMYVYGFMALYIPGLLLLSKAALLAAVFNHIYIWVHYWFTEQPDMEVIYGSKS